MANMLRNTVFLTVLFLLACGSGSAQLGKLYPTDEAAKDPSFFTFRARLLRAIKERDSVFLLSSLDPKIRNTFGSDGGIAEFRKMWRPESANSEVWSQLLNALALGGKFSDDLVFSAPYVYSNFPDEFDAFEHGAIIGEGVRVRKEPNTKSEILTTLSFDIVKVIEWGPIRAKNEKTGWVAVEITNGQKGYVAEDFIRSPAGYRALFGKQNGRWLMTAFVTGD
jgi:Bacterial SH3 domain